MKLMDAIKMIMGMMMRGQRRRRRQHILSDDAGHPKRVWIGNECTTPKKTWSTSKSKSVKWSHEFCTPQLTTHLPTSRNSPTRRCRLMAMSMPRTVMPSQKQATTRALGRWTRSFWSSLSKLLSPALLYILSEWAMQIPSFVAMSLNASIPLSP